MPGLTLTAPVITFGDVTPKPCRKCGSTERHRDGRCKQCCRRGSSAYYAKNKDKVRDNVLRWKSANRTHIKRVVASWNLRKKYGITIEDYEAILSGQDSRCAICRSDTSAGGDRLAVDHCHKTGKIRGLLCFDCNVAIGKFKDSPELLLRAIEYLRGWEFFSKSEIAT